MIRLQAGSATDPGRVRTSNQDRLLVVGETLFAVADGMGGHRGGEVAAQIVADGLSDFASSVGPSSMSPTAIAERLEDLNAEILHRAAMSDDLLGMGTTLTMLLQTDAAPDDPSEVATLLVVNVGDSRTYLLRNGELQQLTDDHSVVADLLREGRITPDEARTHRQRSVITRALGVDAGVDPDIIEIIPAPGSRYLLCSDGLTNEVPDQIIGSILRRIGDPQDAATELVRLALERGGRDNVSVVVVDVIDDTGHDEMAERASSDLTSVIRSGPREPLPETSGTQRRSARRTERRAGPRKPRPVNIRVIVFLAFLAALGVLVFAVVKNSPKAEVPVRETSVIETPSGSTIAVGAPTTVPFIGPTTSIDDFAPVPTTATRSTTRAKSKSAKSNSAKAATQPVATTKP